VVSPAPGSLLCRRLDGLSQRCNLLSEMSSAITLRFGRFDAGAGGDPDGPTLLGPPAFYIHLTAALRKSQVPLAGVRKGGYNRVSGKPYLTGGLNQKGAANAEHRKRQYGGGHLCLRQLW